MIHSSMKQNKFYLLLSVLFSLVIWHLLSYLIGSEIILPSPIRTLQEFFIIVRSKDFFVVMYYSILRILVGFFISFMLACIFALVASINKWFDYLIRPYLITIKSVPTMAIILLAVIWLKSDFSPMLVSSLVCFPIVFSNVFQGFKTVDKKLIEMANVFNVGFLDKLSKIYLPHLKAYIFAGASTALSLSVKVTIAAEVLSQPIKSIGGKLQIERINLNTAGVFAWALVAILLATIFESALKFVFKKSHTV